MSAPTQTVFIGFGSNVGDRKRQIARAAYRLGKADGMRLIALSPLYESPAMLPEDAPEIWDRPFINAVARYETSLAPEALLVLTQAEEQAAGRKDRGKWGPRELDVDLLAYEDVQHNDENLTLPHEGIAMRDFVLLPWLDIAPDWPYPPIADLRAALLEVTAKRV